MKRIAQPDLCPSPLAVGAGALSGKELSVRQTLHKKPSLTPSTQLISPLTK